MITYPRQRMLVVIDQPEAAREAAAALTADGIAPIDVEVLVGSDGRERLGRLGPPPNPLSRLVRIVQFLSMDQLPDFLVYERAIEGGRAVIAVRVPDRPTMLRALARLEGFGAHFANHYGRLSTEELSMWRGIEPDIPGPLRR
jgi:hypothetical protein